MQQPQQGINSENENKYTENTITNLLIQLQKTVAEKKIR